MSTAVAEQAVKETPIIFGGESVRAILEGRKTQTRRLRNLKLINADPGAWHFCDLNGYGNAVFTKDERAYTEVKNPYGDEGDRLWVKEAAWAIHDGMTLKMTGAERARYQNVQGFNGIAFIADHPEPYSPDYWRKVNPMFLPRWASRLTVEITRVRVERLQSITEADAIAEGCVGTRLHPSVSADEHESAREQYARVWDELNKARGFGWNSNPFVWVIEFRGLNHIEAEDDARR